MASKPDILQKIEGLKIDGKTVSKLRLNLISICGVALDLGKDREFWDDPKRLKNLCRLVNFMLYSNQRGDSFHSTALDSEHMKGIIAGPSDFNVGEYDLTDVELSDALGDAYLDWREYEVYIPDDTSDSALNLARYMKASETRKSSQVASNPLGASRRNRAPEPITDRKMLSDFVDVSVSDEKYWTESVRLDRPMIPQPDIADVELSFEFQTHRYELYGESVVPFNQSQITSMTNVNRFSKDDLLRLYPKIRLYTRSPYMYKQYEGLDYDEDLGTLFKVKGFTKKQVEKNLLEYPHLEHLDRKVKIKGKDVTIPFWKHVEIDGEIHPTVDVWDKLPDTKKLPKTESFMSEYVTRKYLLERDVKGVEHNFPMRGTLLPYLTLYAPSDYYSEKGYDAEDLARKCVEARRSFKESRNPVIQAYKTLNIESNVD